MRRKGARILVVDDEPDMVENLNLLLRQAGYQTLAETDSRKVTALVEKEQPDLVLSDLRMPEIDGIALLEKIKGVQPDIPVILLTAYTSVDSAVDAMKKGASDYLSKPFSPDELLVRVEKALTWTELTEENRFLRERGALFQADQERCSGHQRGSHECALPLPLAWQYS